MTRAVSAIVHVAVAEAVMLLSTELPSAISDVIVTVAAVSVTLSTAPTLCRWPTLDKR